MKYKLLIISVLGYILAVSCGTKPDNPYDFSCNYVINGTIFGVDSVSMENISVKMYEVTADLPPRTLLCDSCISNKSGFYEVKNINVIPYVSNTYELHLSDIYQQRDNLYKDTVITVVFVNESFIDGDNGTFLGETFWNLDIFLKNNEHRNLLIHKNYKKY